MKKFSKVCGLIALIICCTCLFSACDLSHKHYLDNYGVCKQCGEDTADLLTLNANNEYVSSEKYGQADSFVYFKFVSNGENGVSIVVEEVSAAVSYINLYTKTTNNLYLSHLSGSDTYVHSSSLTEGETYYIGVKLAKAGKIKISVSPNVES